MELLRDRKAGHLAHAARLGQVSPAMNYRNDKRVRETVTHQRGYRRAQASFIVVDAVGLPNEIKEGALLFQKMIEGPFDV